MAAVLLGQNKPEAPKQEVAKTEEFTHRTAFLVLIDEDGSYLLEADINVPVNPKRKPNAQEIKASLATLLMDIQTQETAMLSANATVSMQMQMAQRMSDAAQNAQIAQMLNKGK
jgi:phosphotransacetylase